MGTKCPMCGAPMESSRCDYCGYVEKEVTESTAYAKEFSQQPPTQSQTIQPQIVINTPPISNADVIPGVSRKSKTTALLLCIFLGVIGAHKFYVGKVGGGILYLLTGGLCGIGWFVDILIIATGSFKDEFGLPLKQ